MTVIKTAISNVMKKIPMTLGDYLSHYQRTNQYNKKSMPIVTPSYPLTAPSIKRYKKVQVNPSAEVPVAETSAAAVVVPITEPKAAETTTVEVKKKKMKKWPDNKSAVLPYEDLVKPLKELLEKGYRLYRKAEIKEFEYEGYNIGEQELHTYLSPKNRFLEKSLEHEKKLGNNLVDVVFNVLFLLGVEQGRRAERIDSKPVETLIETLEVYREKNKDLRLRIDELEVIAEVKENYPNLSEEEIEELVSIGLEERRIKRIEDLKTELQLDASKSAFQFRTPVKMKFRELVALFNTLSKEECSFAQWKEILKENGWTYAEWKEKIKKK